MKRMSALAIAASLLVLAAACMDEAVAPSTPTGPGLSATARGQAMARAYCASCHGSALTGDTTSGEPAPSLVVVQQEYSWTQLDTLLCAGLTYQERRTDGTMPTNASRTASTSPWATSMVT